MSNQTWDNCLVSFMKKVYIGLKQTLMNINSLLESRIEKNKKTDVIIANFEHNVKSNA